jgi:hypothetical protein
VKIGDLLRVTSAVMVRYGPNIIKDPPGWAIVSDWHDEIESLPEVTWLKPAQGPSFLNSQLRGDDVYTVVETDSDAPDEIWGLYYAYQLTGEIG